MKNHCVTDVVLGSAIRSWRGTWTFPARAAGGLVILAAGLILASGYALAAVGDITEYSIPTACFTSAITAGADGNLWFTEGLGFGSGVPDKVAKVTTSGGFSEYPLPNVQSHPTGIAAGPDGNLWVTESGGNTVAKVTISGAFTEYTIPTIASDAQRIAAGPDGNLWFTEFSVNKVAKVTTSGAITEYTIPTAGSFPFDIAAGPDGNLWFTETAPPGRVAKVTTAGVVTEYLVPTAFASPSGIAAGPDGNVWFTETTGGQKAANAAGKLATAGDMVAKVTPAGVITEYPVPTTNSFPAGIAAGRDGNLWLTESLGNKVARVTTAGVVTEYPVPTANASPSGIAAGPDGNLWFTESIGTLPNISGKVAKIVAGPQTASPSPSSSPVGSVSAANSSPALPNTGGGPLVPARSLGLAYIGLFLLVGLSGGAALTRFFRYLG